jgi:flagellar protein FliO/FliZ
MDSLFGAESTLIVRFVVAFVIVLALIGLTFWIIRRFGTTRVGAAAQRGRQPRLAVIDAAPVDGRRRLVLVRRDNVEHLLMIGGPSDIVVEMNIVRAVPVNAPRDVPVPRQPGAEGRPDTPRPTALEEESWEPAQRAAFRPEPRAPRAAESRPVAAERPFAEPRPFAADPRGLAPEPRGLAPEPRGLAPEPRPFLEPSGRPPPLPAGLAPGRPVDPTPIVPAAEPAGEPDAALANMAQRLEAALRRPGAPVDAPRPQAAPRPEPALELAGDSPAGAPDPAPPQAGAPKGPNSKSVLDSLEQEMASLLGRPPEKQ